MICSEEVCCIAPSTCSVEFDSKVGSGSESIPPHVKKLLSSVHGHEVPLVPNEVAIHLLKIQSKYLDEHPCLCTSRFRHTLHQLGDESHQRLDKLCNELQLLTIENCEEVSTAESRRNFYNFFLPTIFDLNSLQLLAVPAVVDSGEIRKSVPVCSRDDERQVLVTRLESILARFVSDYRAIFAIEGECNNPIGIRPDDDPSSHSIVDHEHRKRHEEEDTCPEEIKLMKVACAELSLECSSSVAEVPKKDRRGSKTLQVIIPNNNNNFNTKSLEENSEPERDHHVHRYYSFLRSEHSRKGSHHSTRDPNHPHRHHGHHHHSHHGHHQNHHHHVQHNHELNSNAASSSYLEPSEAKEVSPRPQKWSPNIHNSTAVFQFSKVLPELDTKVTTTTEELQLISTAPRKRKDSKGSDPEHTDTKRISRSSSEILNGEDSVSQNHDDEEILRRTQSFCEAAIKLTEIQTSEVATNKPSGATSNQAAAQPTVACSFYVSDEDLSSQTPIDEIDYTTLGHPGFSATDDSNGSLVGRFDRDMGLHGKSYRPLDRSQRSRRSPRSRSSHKRKSHDSDEKPSEEVKPVVEDNTLEIGVKIMLEREDSFDSSLSSSPSSASSNSMTSENGPTTAEDDFEEDDEITIREDLKSNPDFDDELTFPRLRRASWGSIEPAVQDHMQTPDIQEPVVSWIPQIGLVRESPSALSSENDDFSSRHFGLLHSQKHLDPTHIQRLAIEKDSKRSKLKQLNKQLKSTRRKLEDLEEEFERNCGYKASHSEKQKNEKFRRLLSEQSKLRKQIQSCKESDFGHVDESVLSSSFGSNSSNMLFGTNMNNMSASSDDSFEQFVCESPTQTKTCAGKSLEAMTTFFISLEQKMKSQRTLAGRPFLLEEMTNEQILEEKRDLRSILHQMEMNFGYPSSEEEKNVTKDVFERYRTAKRMFRKNSATFRSKDSVELETIPEDLEIPLTLASPQHRIFIEVTTSTTVDQRASEVRPSLKSMNFFSSNTDEASFRLVDENLHAMSRFELMEIQRRTREEKKHYRRIVKEKEDRFLRDNALRRIPKEERLKIDEINYNLYKKSKAKLKLIEALLSKGRQ